MRPLPTTVQAAPLATKPVPSPVVAQTLELGPLHPPSGPPSQNRRAAANTPVQRAYPWLLIASTALAAIFCGLYLNKPVVIAGTPPEPRDSAVAPFPPAPALVAAAPKPESLLPRGSGLPGDATKPQASDPRRLSTAGSGQDNAFEETNLRIQHVLKAEGPAGESLGKIMLEVPVLYRSRSLRWTAEEIVRARELMTRIGHYQEASQLVRNEGQKLMEEWHALVGGSVPTPVLRADSPSLSGDLQPLSGDQLDSTEAIEIQHR